MQKFTADLILSMAGPALQDTVIVTDDKGKILALEPSREHDPASVKQLEGVLVPGFVNAHCHLELSHMKGVAGTGTGLIAFITDVVTKRGASPEQIQDAIAAAEAEMLRNGIVAVGDISNTTDTFSQKSLQNLYYHTFIECFDLLQDEKALETFRQYDAVAGQHPAGKNLACSFTAHAAYTVSESLYPLIRGANQPGAILSIHNQETPAEEELFQSKQGELVGFYAGFGISLDDFQPTGRSSVYSLLPHLQESDQLLLVHNTLTREADIHAVHAAVPRTYWVTCPNANLYIENRLPDYRHFLRTGAKVAVGTDSLTSNWQLDILEELKTLRRYKSYLPAETLLTWATRHGAEALGISDRFGTLEPGKEPGILHLSDMRLDPDTRATRLV